MNKFILVSKVVYQSGKLTLEYAPLISFSKETKSGVFISQNNHITQVVTKEVFDKAVIGQIKEVSYQFN